MDKRDHLSSLREKFSRLRYLYTMIIDFAQYNGLSFYFPMKEGISLAGLKTLGKPGSFHHRLGRNDNFYFVINLYIHLNLNILCVLYFVVNDAHSKTLHQ